MNDEVTIGQIFADRFEVVALVGRGGMATVYEARDLVLGRTVAVKLFTIDTADDRARLESEIRLLSGLNHPNLVTVHDAHIAVPPDNGPSFLVMEFVTGNSLQDVASDSPLSGPDAAAVARDIGRALRVVHDAGIVHRDVKPANILIERDARAGNGLTAKLADFGIAHSLDATRLTAVGTIVGTAAYLSPEQSEGGAVTTASDIYSLGLVLLECLTGRREYPGTIAESLAARLSRDPVVPAALPGGWSDLLSRMLSREPENRPAAAAVARAGARLTTASIAALATDSEKLVESPTQLMPTLVLPSGLDGHSAPPVIAVTSVPTVAMKRNLAADPTGPARKRRWLRRAVLVAALVVVAGLAFAIVAALLANGSSGSPGAPRSTTPSSAPTTTLAPAPSPTPPGKGNGNGRGHGNGDGKNH